MQRSRVLRGVLLVAAVAVLGLSLSATAEAHGVDQYGHQSNGCTNVPDFVFHSACDQHDWCYDSPEIPNSEVGRLTCDDRFLGDMYQACSSEFPTVWYKPWTYVQRGFCDATAQVYYQGVRTFGAIFFKKGGGGEPPTTVVPPTTLAPPDTIEKPPCPTCNIP
jgi:Prokaryotic phospholipase A2